MQSRNLLLLIVIFLSSSLFLASCAIPLSVRDAYDFQSSEIDFLVNESETKLVIVPKNNDEKDKCKKNIFHHFICAYLSNFYYLDFCFPAHNYKKLPF